MTGAVSAGTYHTCAVTDSGGVKCWGLSGSGQLGDGRTYGGLVPVDVIGLGSGVATISAGGDHTCALTESGAVKCWGANSFGQLGDGTRTNSSVAVDVSGLGSGVQAISAGTDHTCALTVSGAVKCWGSNGYGQLGDGTRTNSSVAVDVSGLGSGVQAISAGNRDTCAVTDSGAVKCWGWNRFGQLGDGTRTDSSVPVDVSGLGSGVAVIRTGGKHTCALTVSGGVKCWGTNREGQLGDGTTMDSSVPVDVKGLGSGVKGIRTGGQHTCALTDSGGVKCWGYNSDGQLGDDTNTDSSVPVDVSGLGSGVAAISAGNRHTCARTVSGGVKCWGYNGYGQLGDNTRTSSPGPVGVKKGPPGSAVAAISVGGEHSCALTDSGAVKCWGRNRWGQLGDGATTDKVPRGVDSSVPVDVRGLGSGVAAISAGTDHTCALTVSGAVKCWGRNLAGELGDGSETPSYSFVPVDVRGLGSGVVAISAGINHTCALTNSGGVKCWGNNSSGELGDGSATDRPAPVDVRGLGSGVAAISAGYDYTCALTVSGGVKCLGTNVTGQLGDGTTTNSSVPVDVKGLGSGVAAISAGHYQTCALTNSRGVKCWGANGAGQLGDGTTTPSSVPVDVKGLGSGVAAISAGPYHTCALIRFAGAKCWGANGNGQLGDGTTANSSVPVDVRGLGNGVAAISAGGYNGLHTCAVTDSGTVQCWGANGYGQLGDGTTTNSSVPVDVKGLVAGNDVILGRAGGDVIDSGLGNDRVFGGPGNDVIDGGPGNDRLSGGRGNDVIHGGPGQDVIHGGPGNDRIVDHQGATIAFPGSGTNQVDVADGRGGDRVVCASGSTNHIAADHGDRIARSCRGKRSTIRYIRFRQPRSAH